MLSLDAFVYKQLLQIHKSFGMHDCTNDTKVRTDMVVMIYHTALDNDVNKKNKCSCSSHLKLIDYSMTFKSGEGHITAMAGKSPQTLEAFA